MSNSNHSPEESVKSGVKGFKRNQHPEDKPEIPLSTHKTLGSNSKEFCQNCGWERKFHGEKRSIPNDKDYSKHPYKKFKPKQRGEI